MKFSDILKTIGLSNSGSDMSIGNGKFNNNTIRGRITKIPGSDVDRVYHGNHHHQIYYPIQDSNHHHSHHPMELGLGASTGNVYYPMMHVQKGYGLKLGGVNTGGIGHHNHHHHHHGGGYGMPDNGGYGQIGYSPHSGSFIDHIEYGTSRKKSSGSSIMTALTLLSFFFFLNTLQNCLKDHIQAMNPTVMVMTAGNARGRTLTTARENLDIIDDVHDKLLNESNNNSMNIKASNKITYPNNTRYDEIVKINSKIELNDDDFYRNNENSHFIRIN